MESTNFIEEIINEDLKEGRTENIVTRFPPEPNGYLHIGHAKAIAVDFGMKEKYSGTCNLRFDDTNPSKEENEYVEAIKNDIEWLGYRWDKECYASDYFDRMYECAEELIKKGLAYVCDFSAEEIKNTRGSLTEAGKESPYRARSVEENLKLFREMREGKYADGEKVLRAKIDMASPNMNMRDPVIYRILRANHHRTGNKWVIYPMYDFAHPLEDAFEGITHSLCTLEFEDHRPIYDWVKENCGFHYYPRQIEFARLNISRTIMSKRYLKKLVDEGFVSGWDDPRMPTLSGMRERGIPPEAIRDFCARVGVAKANSTVDPALLDYCVREFLNERAPRRMVVKQPLKVEIANLNKPLTLSADNLPSGEGGKRELTLTKTIYIDRSDFEAVPPPKYKRLTTGGKVRLLSGCIVEYVSHETAADGNVEKVVVNMIEDSVSGGVNASMKVKGTVQWVSAESAIPVTLIEYDHLLLEGEGDFSTRLNADSLKKTTDALAERSLGESMPYERFQFVREGYYMRAKEDENGQSVFRLITGLKDGYKPVSSENKGKGKE